MLHVLFRSVDQLKGACERFSETYSIFLSSANVPPSLEDDIRRLTEQHMEQEEQDANRARGWLGTRLRNFFFIILRFSVLLYEKVMVWNAIKTIHN